MIKLEPSIQFAFLMLYSAGLLVGYYINKATSLEIFLEGLLIAIVVSLLSSRLEWRQK